MAAKRPKQIIVRKAKPDKSNSLALQLFTPATTWSAPHEFPDLSEEPILGVDIEAKDPNLKTQGPGFIRGDAFITGYGLATRDRKWYFPVRHLGGGNLDPDMVHAYIKDTLKHQQKKVFHNAPYDLEGLERSGIKVGGKIYDTQVNEALICEEREEGYSLDELCLLHLGENKEEAMLRLAAQSYGVDPKSGLWKLPAKYVGAYAEADPWKTLKVFDKQMVELEKQDLLQIFDLETRLIPVIHAMRMRGIPVDLEYAAQLSKELKKQEDSLRYKLFKEQGCHINDQSAIDLAKLADKLNVLYPRTKTGLPSFKADWLEVQSHPVFQQINQIRQVCKCKDDYVDKIIRCAVKGRLHTSWKQLASDEGGTRTGRLAAANPPLQQFPASKFRKTGKPNPIGIAIRKCLVADKGLKWMKGDFSQQEPRLLIHFAALCNMDGAEAAAFTYRARPETDFYDLMVDIAFAGDCGKRRPAKTTYLAVVYGMGKDKYAHDMRTSVEEALRVKAEINREMPFLQQLADKCSLLAQQRGYIRTLAKRKRHFNYWEPVDAYQMRKQGLDTMPKELEAAQTAYPGKKLVRAMTHKALNSLLQGSAADMIKMGMVKGYEEEGRVPYLSMHDEIGGGVEDEADGTRWENTMNTAAETCVPIRMDCEIGDSWK